MKKKSFTIFNILNIQKKIKENIIVKDNLLNY